MKLTEDRPVTNLYSLYNFIGNNFNESTLVIKPSFKYINAFPSVWPNVIFDVDKELFIEELNAGVTTVIKQETKKPILFFDDDIAAANSLRKAGYMPVERWTGMEYSIDNSSLDEKAFFLTGCELKKITINADLDDWIKLVSKCLFAGRELSKQLFKIIAEAGNDLLSLIYKDQMIGAAMIYYDESKIAGVYMVCIDEAFRNHGFGRELMKYVLSTAVGKEIKFVVLQSTKAGYTMYKKMNFRELKKYNLYFKIK